MTRTRIAQLATTVAVVVASACTPAGEPGRVAPDGGDAIVGVVEIVGSAPVNVQVVLRRQDDAPIRLTGALAGELRELSGASVAVRGVIGPSPDPIVTQQVEVSGYDIVSVNGASVIAGEVISVSGGSARLRTDSGEEVVVSGAPASFRVGQKVWVQGPRSVTVQSYGTLRQ